MKVFPGKFFGKLYIFKILKPIFNHFAWSKCKTFQKLSKKMWKFNIGIEDGEILIKSKSRVKLFPVARKLSLKLECPLYNQISDFFWWKYLQVSKLY